MPATASVRTIARAFELAGLGLHSGLAARVRLLPASASEGRYFVVCHGDARSLQDSRGSDSGVVHTTSSAWTSPRIPAQVPFVASTVLSTTLGVGGGASDRQGQPPVVQAACVAACVAEVRTVEHLLAALAGEGIGAVRIEVRPAEGASGAHAQTADTTDAAAGNEGTASAGGGITRDTSEFSSPPHPSVSDVDPLLRPTAVISAASKFDFTRATSVEVPILDGSSSPWCEGIRTVGTKPAALEDRRSGDLDAAAEDTRDGQRDGLAGGARAKRGGVVLTAPVIVRAADLGGDAPGGDEQGDAFVAGFPAAKTKLTCGIEFDQVPGIGRQWYSWEPPEGAAHGPRHRAGSLSVQQPPGPPGHVATHAEHAAHAASSSESSGTPDSSQRGGSGEDGREDGRGDGREDGRGAEGEGLDFLEAVGAARTFTVAEWIPSLREAGLIQGGSLDCAAVCSMDPSNGTHGGWLNPEGPRFADEPVRHKLLDLVGDLSLADASGAGELPVGHVVAFKASHRLHVAFARKLHEMHLDEMH